MTRFPAHGDTQITVEGQLLHIVPEGHGNAEEITRIFAALAEVLPQIPNKNWGALIIARADTLLTPEAEAMLTAGLPDLVAQGHVATAVAILNPDIRVVMAVQFRRLYSAAGARVEIFTDELTARTWIRQLLLPTV